MGSAPTLHLKLPIHAAAALLVSCALLLTAAAPFDQSARCITPVHATGSALFAVRTGVAHAESVSRTRTPNNQSAPMQLLAQLQDNPYYQNPTIIIPRIPPPPRGRFRLLRFSRDGQYVLAKEESLISILTVRPFSVVFQVPVSEARFASFTPDSKELILSNEHLDDLSYEGGVFSGPTQYVERWNLSDGSLIRRSKLTLRPCESAGLSPDGRFLACLTMTGTLSIIDVFSEQKIFERANFAKPVYSLPDVIAGESGATVLRDAGTARIFFSPEGRYLLVQANNRRWLAWDLRENKDVDLGWALRRIKGFVAFVAADRLVTVVDRWADKVVAGAFIEFPSGKVVAKVKMLPRPLHSAADPRFVIVSPIGPQAALRAAAINLATGAAIISGTPALDVAGDLYVAELANEQLGLYTIGKGLQVYGQGS